MSVFTGQIPVKLLFVFTALTRANSAVTPKANFLIIQVAALTGIQRWGCGWLKLEGCGKRPDVVFSQTPYEDELETGSETHFPYSLFFLNAADQPYGCKSGRESCIV